MQYLVDGQKGSEVTEVVHTHEAPHAPAPPRRGMQRVMGPGFIRAAWVTPLFWAIGAGIVVFFRWLGHYEPLWDWPVITVVAFADDCADRVPHRDRSLRLLAVLHLGAPDEARTTMRATAPTAGSDYFKVNTDHKVIGVQYLATTFFFFVVGGLMAMIFRAELANPDMQYVDTQTFNGLVSEHAALMIFLFIIPAFAGSGELRRAADAGRARTWRSRA